MSGELRAEIRRRVQENPALAVGAHRHGRLRAAPIGVSGFGAVTAAAIPLRDSTTCRRAKDDEDRKSTRLNSSHLVISYAVFCLKKKTIQGSPSSIQKVSAT